MKACFSILGFVLAVSAPASAATEAQLVAAAKKEGVLQLTSNKLIYTDILIEAFTKRYPFVKVKHETFDAASQDGYDTFESKDPAERSDVMLRCQDADMLKWTKLGWLEKLNDLPNWKSRPKRLEDDSRYVYFIGSPHVIAYNPDKLQESDLPKTYDELLDPKWDHKVVMRNPLGGNSPAFFVQFIEQKHGGLGWFEKFGKNHPFIAVTGPAVHAVVQKGDHPIALSRDLEVMTFNKRTQGPKLKFKYIENDLPYQYQLGLMSSHAPHKASARLFMNWLLSKEARDVLEQNGFHVGDRQVAELKRPTTFQWYMTKGGRDYARYRSTLFEAQRDLKSGGAMMQEKAALQREDHSGVAQMPND